MAGFLVGLGSFAGDLSNSRALNQEAALQAEQARLERSRNLTLDALDRQRLEYQRAEREAEIKSRQFVAQSFRKLAGTMKDPAQIATLNTVADAADAGADIAPLMPMLKDLGLSVDPALAESRRALAAYHKVQGDFMRSRTKLLEMLMHLVSIGQVDAAAKLASGFSGSPTSPLSSSEVVTPPTSAEDLP